MKYKYILTICLISIIGCKQEKINVGDTVVINAPPLYATGTVVKIERDAIRDPKNRIIIDDFYFVKLGVDLSGEDYVQQIHPKFVKLLNK